MDSFFFFLAVLFLAGGWGSTTEQA
jgi:hypothetical protein